MAACAYPNIRSGQYLKRTPPRDLCIGCAQVISLEAYKAAAQENLDFLACLGLASEPWIRCSEWLEISWGFALCFSSLPRPASLLYKQQRQHASLDFGAGPSP